MTRFLVVHQFLLELFNVTHLNIARHMLFVKVKSPLVKRVEKEIEKFSKPNITLAMPLAQVALGAKTTTW